MPQKLFRILVVDDYPCWRQWVISTLRRDPQFGSITEACDGLKGVEKAQELQPDLIVLDIGLPLQNGIEAGRQILRLAPLSKILFASGNRSREIVEASLGIGAHGYLLKCDAAVELLPAIDAVLRGQRFLSSSVSLERCTNDNSSPSDRAAQDLLRSTA